MKTSFLIFLLSFPAICSANELSARFTCGRYKDLTARTEVTKYGRNGLLRLTTEQGKVCTKTIVLYNQAQPDHEVQISCLLNNVSGQQQQCQLWQQGGQPHDADTTVLHVKVCNYSANEILAEVFPDGDCSYQSLVLPQQQQQQ